VRQFFLALRAAADPRDLGQARAVLTPETMKLFVGMQSSEQAHAVSVYRQLVAQGETCPDLLAAALLHDVGKSLSPLRLWERVLIVLAKASFPAQSRRWGSQPAEGLGRWRRAFVVAEQHPAWGAVLAAEAGASPRTVALIRQHQEPASAQADPETKRLLSRLQAVDDSN
jgi:hypothetical protein